MPFKPDTAAAPRFRPDTPEAAPSEIPRRAPPISVAGDRATGFRQQVEETGMTPEQRQEAVKGIIPIAASLAAGPVAGSMLRTAAATTPAVLSRFAPTLDVIGKSIMSGGLAPGLTATQRVIGGGGAGAASGVVADPESAGTSAAIGVLTPAVAKVARVLTKGAAPTTKEIKDLSQIEYNSPEVLNATVNAPAFQTLRNDLGDIAANAQYLATKHPRVAKALTIMDEQSALGQPVSLERLDDLRRDFASAANSSSFREREIGKAMVGKIDEFIRDNTDTAAADRIEKARELYTYMSRSKLIDDIIDKAQNAKSGDASKIIRDEFRKIAKGSGKTYAAKQRQFTAAELKLIEDIGEGRLDINMLRSTANLLAPTTLNRNLLMTLPGYGALAAQFGPTVGAGAAAVSAGTGLASRALANRLALMRADQLRAIVGTGGAAPQRFAPTVFPQVAPAGTNALAPGEVDFMQEQERVNSLGF